MANPAGITGVVFIYNSDDATGSAHQSLVDAQWYASVRGLTNVGYLGFNFGSTNLALTPTIYASNTTVSCQAASYNGANVSSTYSGQSMQSAFQAFCAAYPLINCVLVSTFTPWELGPVDTTFYYPLSGYMGNNVSPALAHGRLSFPAVTMGGDGVNWNDNIAACLQPANTPNVLTGGVTSLLYYATMNGIAAQKANNSAQYHWSSSTEAYTPYITAAENASILTYWKTQGVIDRVDLGGTTGTKNLSATNFYAGTLTPKTPLFALCMGDSNMNTFPPTGDGPSQIGFNGSYSTSAGAWGFTWNSYNYMFGANLLYNGGSAVLCDVGEPLAPGLLDPLSVVEALWNGASMTQIPSLVTISYPATNTTPLGLVSAHGDPLYAPYQSTGPTTVPNGVGLSQSAVLAAMVEATLLSTLNYAYSSAVASGLCISTLPVAGTTVEPGTNVTITMSAGPTPVAGNGYDKWGADGGGQTAVNAPEPIGAALAYAQQPANAVYTANQSVLAALARNRINLNTSAYQVPASPTMG